MNPTLFSQVGAPINSPLQAAAPQVPLNPMLMLQGLQGMELAGNPGTNPMVLQALSQFQGNPSTANAVARRG